MKDNVSEKSTMENQSGPVSIEDLTKIIANVIQKQHAQQEQLTQAYLTNIFKVPKLRGIQGEKWLESQLKEVLPCKLFSLQYTFNTGTICDSVIFLPNDKKVSIDSKFPLENFRKMTSATNEKEIKEFEKECHKDIKSRINEVSKKYIIPAEGTIDFAFMYVPAESIYYQIFLEHDNGLLDYAFQQKVLIASPSSLYVYLQFVLHGFKGHMTEKAAIKIQQGLTSVLRDLKLFYDEYKKLNDKLSQAQKNFDDGLKHFSKAQANLNDLSELPLSERQISK